MRRFSYIAAIILAAGISFFGQEILCSNVSVDGPTVLLMPGEIATFTSRIQPLEPDWPVKYFWRVSSGKILSGQGTSSIQVESQKYYVIATVSLGGIPREEHCPASASEMARWNIKPDAEKILTVRNYKFEPPTSDYRNVQGPLWDDDQLVVFLGFSGNPPEEDIRTRRSDIIEKLGDKFESTRTTFQNVFGTVNITEFWRVPPGADNPICEGCGAMPCPTISVKGPADITVPGDTMKFSLNPPPKHSENLKYKWIVSAGEIVEGQGTPTINVQTTRQMAGESITVKVVVAGLTNDCPNTSEDQRRIWDPSTIRQPMDHYRKLKPSDQKVRLDSYFAWLANRKDEKLYIILQFSKGSDQAELRKRVKKIKDHIKFRRFQSDRIVILAEPSDKEETIIWQIPSGASEPECFGCKRF